MREFRILITGSRTWDDYNTIARTIVDTIGEYINEHPELRSRPVDWVTIMHGDCPKGADFLADLFATKVLRCNVERYAADWSTHGRSAGFKRNRRMVNMLPDVCLAFIRDKSAGATNCRDLAKKAGIATETINYDPDRVKPPERRPKPKGIQKLTYDDGTEEVK